jgi:hypothetical protein
MEILTIVTSSVALAISVVTLLLNRLLPFKPKVLSSAPTFSLYEITPEISGSKDNKTWWIPSFNVGLSLYNLGKLSGEIIDIRITAELKSNRSNQKFVFYPKWVVNYSIFQKHNTERFTWINEAVISNWSPILLFGGKDTKVHLILEGDRWDNHIEGKLSFTLEYITSKNSEWKQISDFELFITKDMFANKSTYTPYDKKIEENRKI